MSEPLAGNVLVAQSGGPTSVINSSLAGVILEALNYECIENIYGGLHGIQGIINEELIDLAQESQQNIRALRQTPGAALGTCRFKLRTTPDMERVIAVFKAHNIRYFFYIGGNDSQDTASRIAQAAREHGHEMRVIGIPKTIDNDLGHTDHAPGYGSVAKYVATTVKEIAADAQAMGQGDLVHIVEVMGRNTGWIAAASTLAKRREHPGDAPHIILMPERAFDPARFISHVQGVLRQERYCLVVAGEGLVDANGNYLSTASASSDPFGHANLGGVGDYLKQLVESQAPGVRARTTRLGYAQRAAVHCASKTDNDEAFRVGSEAVRAAINGVSDKMITLVRSDRSDMYACEFSLTELNQVANTEKKFPADWINEDGISVSNKYVRYAMPLIQGECPVEYVDGLPRFTSLNKVRVERLLPRHVVS